MSIALLRKIGCETPCVVLDRLGNPVRVVYDRDKLGQVAVLDNGELRIVKDSDLFQVPLAWVEERPVYPNDVLYVCSHKFTALRYKSDFELHGQSGWLGLVTAAISDLSWSRK